MKVAVLILAVAIAGAFAQEAASAGPAPFVCDSGSSFVCKFKEIGHHITYHAKKLGDQLKDVGTSVLSAVLDQGKSLLANGARAVFGTVLQHLNKDSLVGKREEVVASFADKVKANLSNGVALLKKFKAGLHAAFEKAVSKITTHLKDTATLAKVEADSDKKIDDAVAEYEKEGKKGFFGMAKTIAGKIRDIFSAGMDKLRERYGKKVEERAILGFNSLSEAFNKAKEHLSGLVGKVADSFKPHIDTLKAGIASLGDQAREHAGNLVGAAKESFNNLKTKLSGHIETLKGKAAGLKGQAQVAIEALKAALAKVAADVVSTY